MTKAVIFDMDGTMVESEILHYQAYRQALAPFGISLSEKEYFEAWGSDKDMCQRFAKMFPLPISWQELLDRKNKLFRQTYIHQVAPQEGLIDLLKTLKKQKYLLAVCSSSQMEEIQSVIKAIGAESFFDQVVSAESVEHGKPAPDCYLLAAQKLGVNPEDCLVIEDSPKGVAAAKAAGMRCLAIPSTGLEQADFAAADHVVKNLQEASPLI